MAMIGFNVNDRVKVKLTDRGREILRQKYDEFRKMAPSLGPYQEPATDAEGYAEFQLWCLMCDFGPHCSPGFDLPFETTIRFII